MQLFQPILIVIGILAIAGVLIHGFLLNRKEKLALLAEQDDMFEEDLEQQELVSEVRIITEKPEKVDRDIATETFSEKSSLLNDDFNEFHFNIDNTLEMPEVSFQLDDDSTVQAVNFELPEDITETLLDINVDEETLKVEEPAEPADFFVFNAVARDQEIGLGGHELLQFFLTSGFRFGEMDIFHRHENSDGTGEVLFSIANMMAPGTFNLDYMEQFNSPGISFFLTAPNTKVSVTKSFDMMLRAVEQIAEEFNCDVLNGNREPFTEAQFIEYRRRLEKYL